MGRGWWLIALRRNHGKTKCILLPPSSALLPPTPRGRRLPPRMFGSQHSDDGDDVGRFHCEDDVLLVAAPDHELYHQWHRRTSMDGRSPRALADRQKSGRCPPSSHTALRRPAQRLWARGAPDGAVDCQTHTLFCPVTRTRQEQRKKQRPPSRGLAYGMNGRVSAHSPWPGGRSARAWPASRAPVSPAVDVREREARASRLLGRGLVRLGGCQLCNDLEGALPLLIRVSPQTPFTHVVSATHHERSKVGRRQTPSIARDRSSVHDGTTSATDRRYGHVLTYPSPTRRNEVQELACDARDRPERFSRTIALGSNPIHTDPI